jgi:di/tricarboxylate transporter
MKIDHSHKVLFCSVVIGVVLNLVLPAVLKPFATPEQISPPNGAVNLPFFDQLMHMFVHHAQVPVTSSIIVAVIVALSVVLGHTCAKMY